MLIHLFNEPPENCGERLPHGNLTRHDFGIDWVEDSELTNASAWLFSRFFTWENVILKDAEKCHLVAKWMNQPRFSTNPLLVPSPLLLL